MSPAQAGARAPPLPHGFAQPPSSATTTDVPRCLQQPSRRLSQHNTVLLASRKPVARRVGIACHERYGSGQPRTGRESARLRRRAGHSPARGTRADSRPVFGRRRACANGSYAPATARRREASARVPASEYFFDQLRSSDQHAPLPRSPAIRVRAASRVHQPAALIGVCLRDQARHRHVPESDRRCGTARGPPVPALMLEPTTAGSRSTGCAHPGMSPGCERHGAERRRRDSRSGYVAGLEATGGAGALGGWELVRPVVVERRQARAITPP